MVAALSDRSHLDAAMTLRDTVRAAKQDLSEHTDAPLTVAVAGHKTTLTITRDEYEKLITEPVARAAALTARALSTSGTTRLAGLYLTGGTAYTPALARALHPVTGILTAPISDPKLVVAVGALRTPTAVLDPVQLHQLTQELTARRLQQTPPRPVGSVGQAAGPQPPQSSAPQQVGTEPTEPTLPGLPSPPVAQPPTAPEPPIGVPASSRRTKVLAGVLVGVVAVGAAGGLWMVRNAFAGPGSEPTASSTDGSPVAAATCWDGSDGTCPEFSGATAVRYAFTPPDPEKCADWGTMNIEKGLFYKEGCKDDKLYRPYDANLVLWADMDDIAFDMTDRKYQATGTWENADGDTVGTTYTSISTIDPIVYCYDQIPACMEVYQRHEETVRDQFGTLSTDQVRNLVAWLDSHPVADPTAGWDPEEAERAFPAAAGADPLSCSIGNRSAPPGTDKIFTCEWPDESLATVIVWPTTKDAAEAYSDKVAEPWIVDGVERGTVFTDEEMLEGDEKRWCYSDLPYCLRINMTHPDDFIGRIAPLTEGQAADF